MTAKKKTSKKKTVARSKTRSSATSRAIAKGSKKKTVAKKKTAAKPKAKRKAKAAPAKKKIAKKKTAKKKVAKKAQASKKAGKKSAPAKEAGAEMSAAKTRKRGPSKGYARKDLSKFEEMLLDLRERITKQINSLKSDSLKREDWVNSEEDGTDAFDRQFALSLVSSEHEALFEIDEALRRINDGTYGTCEECACKIEKPRLMALPFVRLCVACKSKNERNRPRMLGMS